MPTDLESRPLERPLNRGPPSRGMSRPYVLSIWLNFQGKVGDKRIDSVPWLGMSFHLRPP